MLHIRPWEQRELLTADELLTAFDYIDRMNKEAKESAEKTRRSSRG